MPRSFVARICSLAGLAAAFGAAPAVADVYQAPLSPAKPNFAWNGHGVGMPGFECSNEAEFRCDSIVFSLEVAGDLTVTVDVEGDQIVSPTGIGSYPNFDLYLFKSDAAGAKQGEAIAEAVTPADDEKLVAPKLAAGTYVMEVHSSESIGEDYAGKAKLSNFVLPPAAAAPAAAPPVAKAPAAKPKPSARSRCRAKAKKIKHRSKRARAQRRCSKLKR